MAFDSRPALTDEDVYYLREGTHSRLYRVMGAHPAVVDNVAGARFAVWAPNAARVDVIGHFNDWQPERHALSPRSDGSGIWEGFIAGIGDGTTYKYHVRSRYGDYRADKGDPFAFAWETPPATASRVCSLAYQWGDQSWMQQRARAHRLNAPWSIYEVHLGSWSLSDRNARPLGYAEIAQPLADYVTRLGFTHVELLPVMEHPFYGSWGYQTIGYFAPTARYGTPQDFMQLIDCLHQRGIGVILDWVPSHFPADEHGLAYFDGTHLYEHQDRRKGYHPEWHSCIFNYGRNEVRAFLTSSALFWFDVYHADAIRVDAVASMLYLDYGRQASEWIPNELGGKENLEAIGFLRALSKTVYSHYPDVQLIAEESTAWPMVSRPPEIGGLGFGMKWNMGWMHDTLQYFSTDPVYRKYHHQQLTFGMWYAYSENFLLPLSHDEVVYGKGSLLRRMPGDDWQRFANLRCLFGYMYMHPGKKLLFMGAEFAQWDEWSHDKGLDWHLVDLPAHAGMMRWVEDLNRFYRSEPSLWEEDFSERGFEWIDCNDADQSVLAFLRKDSSGRRLTLAAINFTPVLRSSYQIGAPRAGFWREVLNSDAREYGGSGAGNFGGLEAAPTAAHGRYHSLALTLPPLGVLVFQHTGESPREAGA